MNRSGGVATLIVCLVMLAVLAGAQSGPAPTTDVLGLHDLSSGTSPMHGGNANACIYCHAPHHGLSTTPLWNQTLSTKDYSLYSDPGAPVSVNKASTLCLSCHDGSVAVGQTVAFGNLNVKGKLTDNMGTMLAGSHPFSLKPDIKDAPTLVPSLYDSHRTGDPAVTLIENNVECSTCHDVHNQYRDRWNPKFLVRDNTGGKLCFACHTTTARTVNGHDNTLTAWTNGAHANATDVTVNSKSGLPGSYAHLSDYACSSCHASHDALGSALLRKNPNRPAMVDDTSQACLTCHDGSDNINLPIANVLKQFNTAGQIAHPFADSNNQHSTSEAVVLDRNRHTTCADCHNAHAAQKTLSFPGTREVRPSQLGVPGVTSEGTITNSSAYQYETCMRCHGKSDKKGSTANFGYMPARAMFTGDTLDVSLQFAPGALSSHPTINKAKALGRPSLRKYMYNIGFNGDSRPMSEYLLCTDCHNSDANREFGGTEANGPHGSSHDHILERQYLMSQVAVGASPGSKITINLNLPVVLDPVPTAPYALCAKCHDLSYVNSIASWAEHPRHIGDGFSCSVCHSAHGVPAGTSGTTGTSLVSFDRNVVGENAGKPISYNGSTCTLTCHEHPHGN